jgi:hypothetical protein
MEIINPINFVPFWPDSGPLYIRILVRIYTSCKQIIYVPQYTSKYAWLFKATNMQFINLYLSSHMILPESHT